MILLRHRIIFTLFVGAVASVAGAQTATQEVAKGDRDLLAMQTPSALTHYEAAIKLDGKNVGALWKASNAMITLGEFNDDEKMALYASAADYARRAFAIDSNNADVRFALSQALGRAALTMGPMDRIKYATDIFYNSTTCLKINPKHPGCLHALGMWHAEVMRTDASMRSMAITMLGAKILEKGTWADAQRNLELATKVDPKRTIHHLDLGRVYADMGNAAKAKIELTAAIKAPLMDYNDKQYKAAATTALEKVNGSASK